MDKGKKEDRKFIRDTAKLVLRELDRYKQREKLELRYLDSQYGFYICNLGKNILPYVHARLDSHSDNSANFEYSGAVWVLRKTGHYQQAEIPEREDDKIIIGSEMLPVVNSCARKIGLRAALDFDGRIGGFHPALTFGGKFEKANLEEVLRLLSGVNVIMNLRLKDVQGPKQYNYFYKKKENGTADFIVSPLQEEIPSYTGVFQCAIPTPENRTTILIGQEEEFAQTFQGKFVPLTGIASEFAQQKR